MIEVGSKAPNFRLQSSNGDFVSLEDLHGSKNVVVYFYPTDSLAARRKLAVSETHTRSSKNLGAEVIGISGDNQSSHQGFANGHKLPFVLLSDPDGSVRKAYGVKKSLGIIPGRVSFVINKQGIVRHVFVSQTRTTAHDEALAVLESLEKGERPTRR